MSIANQLIAEGMEKGEGKGRRKTIRLLQDLLGVVVATTAFFTRGVNGIPSKVSDVFLTS